MDLDGKTINLDFVCCHNFKTAKEHDSNYACQEHFEKACCKPPKDVVDSCSDVCISHGDECVEA